MRKNQSQRSHCLTVSRFETECGRSLLGRRRLSFQRSPANAHIVLNSQLGERFPDLFLEGNRLLIRYPQDRRKAHLADDLCQRSLLKANVRLLWETKHLRTSFLFAIDLIQLYPVMGDRAKSTYVDEVDVTNNIAERRIRPAVIVQDLGGQPQPRRL
jgi:hypothetical protein